MRAFWCTALLAGLLAAGCSDENGSGGKDAGGSGDVDGGSEATIPFDFTTLDPAAPGARALAMAVSGDKVGVAYFVDTGGTPPYQLRYVESGGSPQNLAQLTMESGVALAFDSSGVPTIAYFGGEASMESTGSPSLYWKHSDLMIRTGPGWAESRVLRLSGDATGTDQGEVVGIFPSMASGPNGQLAIAARDIHFANMPLDYARSDLEVAVGRPGAWQFAAAADGFNSDYGYGARSSIVFAGEEPAVVFSTNASTSYLSEASSNVWFARRSNGTWSAPIKIADSKQTVLGPSIAWSQALGFSVAFEDRDAGVLTYMQSSDGTNWVHKVQVVGTGSGGRFPTVAIGPQGEPAIAHYRCSRSAGAGEACRPEDDALLISLRGAGRWNTFEADANGAWAPKLGFSGGKAVIVYKDLAKTKLLMARER